MQLAASSLVRDNDVILRRTVGFETRPYRRVAVRLSGHGRVLASPLHDYATLRLRDLNWGEAA